MQSLKLCGVELDLQCLCYHFERTRPIEPTGSRTMKKHGSELPQWKQLGPARPQSVSKLGGDHYRAPANRKPYRINSYS